MAHNKSCVGVRINTRIQCRETLSSLLTINECCGDAMPWHDGADVAFKRRGDDHGPISLVRGLRLIDQRNAKFSHIIAQQVFIMAGAVLPSFEHFLPAFLSCGNVLGGDGESNNLGAVRGRHGRSRLCPCEK